MTWIMSECFMPPVAVAPFSSVTVEASPLRLNVR